MDLLQNPFHILSATTRDSHGRIMELADERSLLLDANKCMAARLALTTPRKRLAAEVAWLPGIGPKRAEEVISLLESSPEVILTEDNLPPAARVNVLAAALSRLPEDHGEDLAEWIIDLAETFESVAPEKLRTLINEERIVAGFPEVTDISAVEAEIQERRWHYRQVIKTALDNLSPKELVDVITKVVESATNIGEKYCPVLMADLVDAFEVDAQEFLDREEKNIIALVEKLRTSVDTNSSNEVLQPIVNKLIQVVKNWDLVAQPIQVCTKSRGLDHDASVRVGTMLRSFTIYLFNEHGKLEFSQQLTNMLQEVFAEVGEIAERTAEDAETLEDIAERKKLNALLDPISNLCQEVLEHSERYPHLADAGAQKVIDSASKLIGNLSAAEPTNTIISQEKDRIALTLMHCAIVYGNKTSKWNKCIIFLAEAAKYADSSSVKLKIKTNINTANQNYKIYGDLEPISSAPSLSTINGIGMALYGATDHEPASRSYLATYYFVFFAIPIFPISRYRVIPTENGYRFLGKAPLRTFDKCHIAVTLFLAALLFLNLR